MKKTNNTKQTLLMSVLSLVLCMSMLIGTTFAWFTDSVSSQVNTIKSGNLDVELYHMNYSEAAKVSSWNVGFGIPVDATGEKVESDTKLFLNEEGKDMLWEPGATSVENFRIKNEGSLALKYEFSINFANATKTPNGKTLADIIKISADEINYADNGVPTGTTKLQDRVLGEGYEFEGTLLPGEQYDFWVGLQWVSSGMDNEFNVPGGLSIDMGVTLVATQDTYEKDGYNSDQYDAQAKFPVLVNDAAGLNDALANATPGTVISLSEDVDYGTAKVGELKDVTIEGAKDAKVIFKTDANSKIENVTLNKVEFEYKGAADFGVVIDPNAQIDNLVIENCTFTGTGAKAGRGLSGTNNNASIVIKDCTFVDLGYPIYAWGGYESLTVDNCTFDNIKSWAIMPQSGFDGDLTVNNCKFINCLGGGLIKAGTLTAGHTFTFTNNTVTDCTVAGDHNWFQFNVSAGNTVIENNIKDGSDWTPTVADGLK